jgi:hypothetical protein
MIDTLGIDKLIVRGWTGVPNSLSRKPSGSSVRLIMIVNSTCQLGYLNFPLGVTSKNKAERENKTSNSMKKLV